MRQNIVMEVIRNYKTTLKYLIEFIPIFTKERIIPLKVDYKFCDHFFFILPRQNLVKITVTWQIQEVQENHQLRHSIGYLVSVICMETYALNFKRDLTNVNELGKA
jgi:hypothetical protein